MKLNKYLKEIGINESNFLFKEEKDDDRYVEDNNGFIAAEFFSLDYTFNLIIYSKLCYFREHIASIATPSCFCYTKTGKEINFKKAEKRWLKVLDIIIEGFKISIITNFPTEEECKKIKKARKLFIEYYDCLWY